VYPSGLPWPRPGATALATVAAGIAARGDSAFLHAWRDNVSTIRLYESLGFDWRSDVHVAVLGRP